MSALRRVATVVLVVVAASWVAAARVGAIPAPIVIALHADCTSSINCKSFGFSLKNGGSQTLNGLTIQVTSPNTITAVSIGGQPAAKETGVQNAWAIYPASIAPGVTVNGTGTVSSPLGSSDVFKFFTTPDGFTTATGQDVHLSTGAGAAASHAAIAPGVLTFAYSPQWSGFLTGHGKTTIRGGYRFLYDPPYYNIYLKQHEPLGAVKEVLSGSLTGSGTVSISIAQLTGPNQCRWLTNSKGDFRAGSCSGPIWLPANLAGKKWTYTLQRALPPGNYTVESRASSKGTSETGFSAAQHNLVKLDVALHK